MREIDPSHVKETSFTCLLVINWIQKCKWYNEIPVPFNSANDYGWWLHSRPTTGCHRKNYRRRKWRRRLESITYSYALDTKHNILVYGGKQWVRWNDGNMDAWVSEQVRISYVLFGRQPILMPTLTMGPEWDIYLDPPPCLWHDVTQMKLSTSSG